MSDIVTAVYNLMGQPPDGDKFDEEHIKDKVENLFNVSLFLKFNWKLRILIPHASTIDDKEFNFVSIENLNLILQ